MDAGGWGLLVGGVVVLFLLLVGALWLFSRHLLHRFDRHLERSQVAVREGMEEVHRSVEEHLERSVETVDQHLERLHRDVHLVVGFEKLDGQLRRELFLRAGETVALVVSNRGRSPSSEATLTVSLGPGASGLVLKEGWEQAGERIPEAPAGSRTFVHELEAIPPASSTSASPIVARYTSEIRPAGLWWEIHMEGRLRGRGELRIRPGS